MKGLILQGGGESYAAQEQTLDLSGLELDGLPHGPINDVISGFTLMTVLEP